MDRPTYCVVDRYPIFTPLAVPVSLGNDSDAIAVLMDGDIAT